MKRRSSNYERIVVTFACYLTSLFLIVYWVDKKKLTIRMMTTKAHINNNEWKTTNDFSQLSASVLEAFFCDLGRQVSSVVVMDGIESQKRKRKSENGYLGPCPSKTPKHNNTSERWTDLSIGCWRLKSKDGLYLLKTLLIQSEQCSHSNYLVSKRSICLDSCYQALLL